MAVGARIEVRIDDQFAAVASETLVRRAAAIALDREHRGGPDCVTVLVTDDPTLRALNRDFRGLDETTDVLSFGTREGWRDGSPPDADALDDPAEGFCLLPEDENHLGDVAISYPRAVDQAEATAIPVERELALLVVHGVLHLLGFDHTEPEREAGMFARTDAILAEVFRERDSGG